MKLGVDTSSLRFQNFELLEALDYAAEAGLDCAQVHRNRLKGFNPELLKTVRARADALGLTLELAMGCIDRHGKPFKADLGTPAEQLTAAIGAAQVLGSKVVQVFIGNLYDRNWYVPFQQRLEEAAAAIKSVRPLIEETGIRPAIENHGDSTARELAALIREIGPEYAGVYLDTGNPTVIAEDPAFTTEILAPYTLMTHFRDDLVWAVEDGAMTQWVPMGAGNTDLPHMASLLKEHAPHASFCLELITGGPPKPVPYLDPNSELWQKVPHTPAPDFARFVALAQKGPAGPLEMIWRPESGGGEPTGEQAEQLKAQQLSHYARSYTYCREALGMGERKN